MKTKRSAWLVALAVAAEVSSWTARTSAAEAPPPASAPFLCFRGRPLPHCTGSFITEVELVASVHSELRPAWSAGYMINVTPRHAFGGLLYTTLGGDKYDHDPDLHLAMGLRGRYRLWFTNDIALDVSPGAILVSTHPGNTIGFSGDIGLNFFDWIAPIVRMEVVRNHGESGLFPGDRLDTGGGEWTSDTLISVGLRLGSYPGALVGGVSAIAYPATYVAVCGGFHCRGD